MDLAENFHQLLSQSIGLLTILNPIAGAAIMSSIMGPEPTQGEINLTARKTAITVFISCLVTVALGELLFNFFGINTFSIEVIGGLVILRMAMRMVEGNYHTNHSAAESKEAIEKTDISIIPLGIPVFFGPGAIATLILFKSRSQSWSEIITLLGVILVSCLVVFYTLKNGKYLSKSLGVTGMKITTRILGLILGAIAVQFIITGVYTLWQHVK
jgi:multiple antibiotic resistance protein